MAKEKVGFFGAIARYFRELKIEIKKIVWPTSLETSKNTGIVLAAITLIGLFVFGLDSLLYFLLGQIMHVSK